MHCFFLFVPQQMNVHPNLVHISHLFITLLQILFHILPKTLTCGFAFLAIRDKLAGGHGTFGCVFSHAPDILHCLCIAKSNPLNQMKFLTFL
jgi:hypothetical protein